MHTFRSINLLLLMTCLVSQGHATTLYKWKDAQGGLHYSQTPPKGTSHAVTIQAHQPTNSMQISQTDNSTVNYSTTSQATPQVTKAPVKLNTNDCANLQQTLSTLQSGQRVFESDANGERAYLTEAQRAERIQRYQQTMNNGCQ